MRKSLRKQARKPYVSDPANDRNIAARAGRWSATHKKTAIVGWFVFVIAAFMIGGAVGKRTEMEHDPVVEPVIPPVILRRDFVHDGRQPTRQRVLEFGDVDIFSSKPEVARQHERRTAIDRDLQLCSRLHGSAPDPVEGVEQRVAVEGCAHRGRLMKTQPPASASSG